MLNSSSPARAADDPAAMARRLMQRAHNRDGLPEIAVGLTFILASGLIYASAVLPRKSIGFIAVVFAWALLLPVLSMGTPWALRWVRRRYLIARVGYVQYRPIGRKQIAAGITLAVVMALAILWSRRLSHPAPWLLSGTGLVGGALSAWCGRLPRFVVGGIAMAITGVLLAFSGVTLEIGFTILFGVQGLVTLISGCIVFWRFMWQPVEAGE